MGKKKIAIIVAVVVVVILAVIGIVIGIHFFQEQKTVKSYDYDSHTCTYPKTPARKNTHYDENVVNSNLQTNENSNLQIGTCK